MEYLYKILIFILSAKFSISDELSKYNTSDEDEQSAESPYVNPYSVREDGCPMVAERNNLNISQLDGNWKMPFASLNQLADIGIALFNETLEMHQLKTICPTIQTRFTKGKGKKNDIWRLDFVCPKLRGAFTFKCYLRNKKTQSKFVCWNDKENRDLYLMIAATDHSNWIVMTRCSPTEPDAESEGMGWLILSKDVAMDPDVSDVLLDLLDGYGFDVDQFKAQLHYDDCVPFDEQ